MGNLIGPRLGVHSPEIKTISHAGKLPGLRHLTATLHAPWHENVARLKILPPFDTEYAYIIAPFESSIHQPMPLARLIEQDWLCIMPVIIEQTTVT